MKKEIAINWRDRAVALQATINELEDQVRSMLRTEFKMFEAQRKFERYIARVEKFNDFALRASKAANVKDLLRETVMFCLGVYSFDEGHVSFVGEFESFSMLATEKSLLDDDPLMMDIRHGKIDYSNKVQFYDLHSCSRELRSLKELFNLDVTNEYGYIIFHFNHRKSSFASLIFKTKDLSKIERVHEQPSRDDMPLFVALHQMIQSELSNKILCCELEHKALEKEKESERSKIMLAKSLLLLKEVQNDLVNSSGLVSTEETSIRKLRLFSRKLSLLKGFINEKNQKKS